MPAGVASALASTDYSQILRSQQPDLSWAPSSIYFWADLLRALDGMHGTGVNGDHFYLGLASESKGDLYGLVNVAAFLAQSMKETIQYDACDENSWDSTSGYSASNSCGQLGQSYQDYTCSAAEAHMACEVDPSMELRATTHAKWYGAPPGMFCAPKSKVPASPKWNYGAGWCDPNVPRATNMTVDEYLAYVAASTAGGEGCRDYAGQKAGRWESCTSGGCPNAAAPNFGRAPRTDVEGCCWWGRGVIQTTGVCNFGKLNYFLGARAAREGRAALFPDVDFCTDPGQICSSGAHPELKWVAGLFYWMNSVQTFSSAGKSFMTELRAFVDGGMTGTAFIDGVSGVVNRGCWSATACPAGAVDGVDDRRKNFDTVLRAMGIRS